MYVYIAAERQPVPAELSVKTVARSILQKDPSKHSGKVVWVQTESDHRQIYDCCDAQVSASEAHDWEDGACKVCDYQCKHTGGSATCVKKAECVICGEQYGVYNMSVQGEV